MLIEGPAAQEIERLRARRDMTERNRAALAGRPGRFYDYQRGCWIFRDAEGIETRWERP